MKFADDISLFGLSKLLCFALLVFAGTAIAEPRLVSVERAVVQVCPVVSGPPWVVEESKCRAMPLNEVDPQVGAVRVKTRVDIPPSWLNHQAPLGFFVFGKTSSEVYINGQLLGRNGTPSAVAAQEFPGKIDSVFYIPDDLLRASNEMTLFLSSHHGYLNLHGPLHFIGVGDFQPARLVFDENTNVSLLLLGALVLGTLYFLVLFVRSMRASRDEFGYGVFALMGLLVSMQLALEVSRWLHSYSYPLHDVRLLLITGLAIAFGLCLLWQVTTHFRTQQRLKWVASTGLLVLLVVWLVPSYDARAAFAILIPSISSTVLIGRQSLRDRTRPLLIFLGAFVLFDLIILLTLGTFHHILFYLLVATMMLYLFIEQARLVHTQKQDLEEEREHRARLNFRLNQLEQLHRPTYLSVTSGSDVHQISSEQIKYCKGAGDYVELVLKDGKVHLYSGTLKELESKLPDTFLRVHRSFVVNLDCVETLTSEGGNGKLILQDQDTVPVSRRVMPSVRETLKAGN